MDAITSAFSSLGNLGSSSGGGDGNWMTKLLPFLGLGGAGLSAIGNIQANNAKNKVLSSEMAQMKALQNLTPSDISKGTMALEQPLSNNLINNITNTTSANLAARGLSQAPGIQAQAIAQGLAPYQLQEQQLAQDAFFKKLGLPISARPSPFGPFPQTSNVSQLWQAVMNRFLPTANQSQGNQVPPMVPEGAHQINQLLASFINPSSSTGGGGGFDFLNTLNSVPSGGSVGVD
jgi:hypothetical protein